MNKVALTIQIGKYSWKCFDLKHSLKDYYRLYLKEEKIGFISRRQPFTTSQNRKEQFFFIYDTMIERKKIIGTIALFFDRNEKRFKIQYVKLNEIPKIFLSTRKVLIEKKQKNAHSKK